MEGTAESFGMTRPVPAGALAPWASLLERAGRLILGVVARHAAARRSRATLRELQTLSARQLNDIGLTRADIDLMDVSIRGSLRLPREPGLYL